MSDILDGLDQRLELTLLLEETLRRKRERKIASYFPDQGPLRRELYPKHLAYFSAGSKYRERLMMAANRIGKTESIGGYEMVLHMTGRYPDWWEGRRFDRAINAWAAGDTGKTTRDILQMKLLGPPGEFGTGLIPKADLVKTFARQSGISSARLTGCKTPQTANRHGDNTARTLPENCQAGRRCKIRKKSSSGTGKRSASAS